MLCPTCKTQLTMSERQGIEIDYCPSCRGVWLDRGELDKIVERSAAPSQARDSRPPDPGWRDHGHSHGQHYGHRKRRKSFLEELFD